MLTLSDLFFFLYFVDLSTLERIIEEARRIFAERERNASQQDPTAKVPAAPSVGCPEGLAGEMVSR
jgi:hypothetical protein